MRAHQFACREDNFGVLIQDEATGAAALIDAPDEGAIRRALAETGWQLSLILVTHKHLDHIDAIVPIKQDYGCEVIAPARARNAVPLVDRHVSEGDVVRVGNLVAKVLETPGHCPDHVTYHFEGEKVAFAGDVIFALGCGRVFDDAYDAMWTSLSRIAAMPDETKVYFGHEYTMANAKFALAVDPDNPALKKRFAEVAEMRSKGIATSPTAVGAEKAANPFLRAVDSGMKQRLGMAGASDAAVFRELRERKNRF